MKYSIIIGHCNIKKGSDNIKRIPIQEQLKTSFMRIAKNDKNLRTPQIITQLQCNLVALHKSIMIVKD